MNKLALIIVCVILSCNSKISEEVTAPLTGNNSYKIWSIELSEKKYSKNWITLWYFSKTGNYLRYSYNIESLELKTLTNGDNLDDNKYYLIGRDSISLNGSKFPIIELSNDVIVLKNIYSDTFFPEDFIKLKSFENNRNSVNKKCDSISQIILNSKKSKRLGQ